MAEEKNQNLNDFFTGSYEQFSDAIFRYCYFQTSSREKALDFTQDTFIKTLEYLTDGNKVENLRAFLYKVARNLIIDDRRRKKSESLDKMQESGFDVKNKVDERKEHETAFDIKTVLEVVDQLELKYREVIMLRYIEDMSVKDIASILKDTENNISVKIHRALKKLNTLLDKLDLDKE
jgi:RNA polymerase sigma-70 factor (ECF subfamily)